MEVRGVGELDVEGHPADTVGSRGGAGGHDVEVVLGHHPAHVGEQAGAVEGQDLQGGEKDGVIAPVPLDLDEPFQRPLRQCGGV